METKIEVPFHLGKSIEQALVVQPPIIKQYENGTAIPNNAFIAKIEKTLGVKLPRVKKIKVVE